MTKTPAARVLRPELDLTIRGLVGVLGAASRAAPRTTRPSCERSSLGPLVGAAARAPLAFAITGAPSALERKCGGQLTQIMAPMSSGVTVGALPRAALLPQAPSRVACCCGTGNADRGPEAAGCEGR